MLKLDTIRKGKRKKLKVQKIEQEATTKKKKILSLPHREITAIGIVITYLAKNKREKIKATYATDSIQEKKR
jgi:hypothetical protein